MPNDPRRILPVPGATNMRDLGGYQTASGQTTRWRRLLRGDSPHRMQPAGDQALRDVGLRSVIDLRSHAELSEEPNPFAALADIDYLVRPVFDDLAPTMQVIKQREPGDLLLDFYISALSGNAPAIRAVLGAVAAAPEGAVLFHCTAGKDRTGIIAALLLANAGVSRGDIVADYALTGPRIAPLVQHLLERTRAHGGDTEIHARFLRCDPPTMSATLDHLEARHGSVPGYLRDIGLDPAEVEALRDRLLAD